MLVDSRQLIRTALLSTDWLSSVGRIGHSNSLQSGEPSLLFAHLVAPLLVPRQKACSRDLYPRCAASVWTVVPCVSPRNTKEQTGSAQREREKERERVSAFNADVLRFNVAAPNFE